MVKYWGTKAVQSAALHGDNLSPTKLFVSCFSRWRHSSTRKSPILTGRKRLYCHDSSGVRHKWIPFRRLYTETKRVVQWHEKWAWKCTDWFHLIVTIIKLQFGTHVVMPTRFCFKTSPILSLIWMRLCRASRVAFRAWKILTKHIKNCINCTGGRFSLNRLCWKTLVAATWRLCIEIFKHKHMTSINYSVLQSSLRHDANTTTDNFVKLTLDSINVVQCIYGAALL